MNTKSKSAERRSGVSKHGVSADANPAVTELGTLLGATRFAPEHGPANGAGPWHPRIHVEEFTDAFELRAEIPGYEEASASLVATRDGDLQILVEPPPTSAQATAGRPSTLIHKFHLPAAVDPAHITGESQRALLLLVRVPKSKPDPVP